MADTPTDRRQQVRLRQQQEASAAKRRRLIRQLVLVGALVLVVAAMIGTAVFFGLRGQSGTAPQANTTVTVDNVSVPFVVEGTAVRIGPADAKAKIDLWVDYSCPHCQEFEAANDQLLNQLVAAGDTSVSYHNIQIVTDYGTQAGSAGACVAANDAEKWVDVNAALYANHSADTDGWGAAQFADFAAQHGVNSAAQTCIQNSKYTDWITANTTASAAAGVSGTPTMFINGEKQEQTPSGDALKAKVDQIVAS
ncbi:MAG TPA: thioredoxin domain-containing protein [Microlunatus sp.]|nr:thioredoxin domain-containing protein [Microlunatus sp.]